MTDVVRQAVIEKRAALDLTVTMMREQWQEVTDQLVARTTELNGVEARMTDLDAWLAADAATNLTVAHPV